MSFASIDKPSKYFNTVTYSGNSTDGRSLTGVGFKPDLVWIKIRSTTGGSTLQDIVRGANKFLSSNSTNAETTDYSLGYLSSFTSDGFVLEQGSDPTDGFLVNNATGQTYVSWNWLGANTTTSNTSGSISSTVSANTTSGFSIVSYTGNGTTGATVGHGLGVAPAMIIQKRRDGSIASWRVWHKSIHATSGETDTLFLNTTASDGADIDNISGVSSTTFTTRGTGATNPSGNTCIAYCFAEVKGFSKFGRYTGNGSSDGTFVYTGFKPAFIIIKPSNVSASWTMIDNKRSPINQMDARLFTEGSDAEISNGNGNMDFLSNGFKPRTSHIGINGAYNYIYMAFAENPFVSSTGIPTTAR